MTSFPPTPPVSPIPPASPDPSAALAKVRPPAIAVIVAMAISMLLQLVSIARNALGMALPVAAADPNDPAAIPAWANAVGGGVGIVISIIGLIAGALVIYCMTRMMRLEQYALAVTGAVIAMVPCVSPCCVLGLPFGIWALVILLQEDVKAAFRS